MRHGEPGEMAVDNGPEEVAALSPAGRCGGYNLLMAFATGYAAGARRDAPAS